MKKIFYLYSKSLLSKLALAALLFVGSSSAAMADELTINESATNTNYGVPINTGKLTTSGIYGEFLLLPSQMSSLPGKNITGLVFYTNKAANWGSAVFTVCLKEVDNTYYTSSTGPLGTDGTTTVYTGGLSSSSDKEVSIVFDTPFSYSGSKSLLVRIDCTNTTGTNVEVNFYGANGTDWSDPSYTSYGTTTSLARQRFQPKVKITYADAAPILSVSPTSYDFGSLLSTTVSESFTVSNIGGGSLDVSMELSGTNSSEFSLSTSSLSSITNGSDQTFTVTYIYNSESVGEKSVTLTLTPSVGDPINISLSATALSNNDPQLSVTPNDNTNLGTVYSGEATYTVTNTGTGTMSVNISSDNSDFVANKSSIEGLGHGESETFTVTYTFAGTTEKLGLNTANITVTPTYEGGEAKTYQVSATSNATMTLDEDNPTTVNYGSKAYLHVKYEPSAGWNTISMPFVLKNNTMNNMDKIFGEGWKAYALSSYNDGVLTFSKVSSSSTIDNGKPYLVYIAEKPTHPNGVLLNDISTTGNNPSSTSKNGATFKGTYVTKTYNEATDVETPWYGVTPSGKVMKAGAGANIKGYRAYFTGISAPSTLGARITLVFEDGGETTDLGFVKMVDPEAQDVYTLSGQKVKKGGKGIYIVNGRKVVIK